MQLIDQNKPITTLVRTGSVVQSHSAAPAFPSISDSLRLKAELQPQSAARVQGQNESPRTWGSRGETFTVCPDPAPLAFAFGLRNADRLAVSDCVIAVVAFNAAMWVWLGWLVLS